MSEERKVPKRGISTYCFYPQLGVNMDLEDIFMHMQDMGATGLEILADGIIPGYPYPSEEWLNKWFGLIKKYDIVPVEYGHWVESRLYPGQREASLEESLEQLIRDIKLAHYLGFTCMRTKLGVISETLDPVSNWREIIHEALPYAEAFNVVMQPEIHAPTKLTDRMVNDYVEFIEKENTKYFGFNIDFGVFQNKPVPEMARFFREDRVSKPEDIIPLLPYVHCCHAKYYNMSADFEETTIPYREVIQIMIEHGWDGYLLSEYEGPHKEDINHCIEQVRRHHVFMKKILGQ
ncbi:MAG: TIM barrel protein [Lachnospiraceae bacterium]|nr:TIM barrel protein [Lachnospiraceae bacterium]